MAPYYIHASTHVYITTYAYSNTVHKLYHLSVKATVHTQQSEVPLSFGRHINTSVSLQKTNFNADLPPKCKISSPVSVSIMQKTDDS